MARVKKPTSLVVKREIKSIFNNSVSVPDGLVTNEAIRQKFFDYINRSTVIPRNASSTIWKLIRNQVIIPVNVKKEGFTDRLFYTTNNKNSVLMSYYDGVLGFYSGQSNRIFMLIDNMEKYKFDANRMSITLIHELQHMQCHNFPGQFFMIHKKLFTNFYTELLYNACEMYDSSSNIKVNETAAALMCKWMIYMFDDLIADPNFGFTDHDMDSYGDKVYSCFYDQKKNEEMLNNICDILINSAKTILNGKYYDNCRNNRKSDERFCYNAIYNTYKNLNLNPDKIGSFFGQELIFPSEIISLLANVKITPSLFAFIDRL